MNAGPLFGVPLPTSLAQVIRAFDVRATEDRYTALPVIVRSYDHINGEVDVELCVKLAKRAEDGSPLYFEHPIIPKVKIAWPRGGGYISSNPFTPGLDTGTLIVSTLDVGKWELTGLVPSEPLNLLRQNLNSCVFIPGWFPDTKPPDPTDALARETMMVIGAEGGVQIRMDGNTIDLGRAATKKVLNEDTMDSAGFAPTYGFKQLVAACADFNAFKAAVAAWVPPTASKARAE